jgi:hypothetical protein
MDVLDESPSVAQIPSGKTVFVLQRGAFLSGNTIWRKKAANQIIN